jgi:hypothetical protein
VVVLLAAALAVPSIAGADNTISKAGTTLNVTADPNGATIEYSAFSFFCFPGPCGPPDYDITSPQHFTPGEPATCFDTHGNDTSYDCNPVPATTNITGSQNADTVSASCFLASARLVLDGRAGDDRATSTCSNSAISMGDGNDTVSLGSTGFLFGGSGTASGGNGDDTLTGGAGTQTLNGDAGKDGLRGGAGNDVLDGGDGADTLDGEAGNDIVRGGGRRDMLTGGAGTDVIEGGSDLDTVSYEDKSGTQPVSISLNGAGGDGEPGENDAIAADVENVIGSVGSDTIVGNNAPNDIVGLDGGDVINPGGGPDVVDAGAGNDRVEARDGAQDRIECGDGNDLAITDEFDSVSNCESVQASRELMADVDADGVPAPVDCDDRDARRRPGFIDKPGNDLDEDCTGADAPYARIFSTVQSTFTAFRRVTRVNRLRVVGIPERSTIRLRCRGGKKRGCFKKVKRFRVPRGAEARNIRGPLRKRKLKRGARIEVRILAKDSIGKVQRFTIRNRSRLPKSRTLCLVPGQNRPGRCPRR